LILVRGWASLLCCISQGILDGSLELFILFLGFYTLLDSLRQKSLDQEAKYAFRLTIIRQSPSLSLVFALVLGSGIQVPLGSYRRTFSKVNHFINRELFVESTGLGFLKPLC